MDKYAEKTGINCPVCDKEFLVGDVIDTAFIARAKSQPALLAACEVAVLALTHKPVNPDETQAFYKGYISLADLAFRLRDEIVSQKNPKKYCSLDGRSYNEWSSGLSKVFNYELEQSRIESVFDWPIWCSCGAQPIHWIIAALIAKELTNER